MAHERTAMTSPLLGSALLHGGLLVATLVSWPWLSKPMRMEASVPVTIVANAPVSNIRPAIQAPAEAEALTEAPVAEATPEPVSPPEPVPPAPAPKPAAKAAAPTPKPVTPQPASKKPAAQRKKAPEVDLDAIAASLKTSKSAGKPKSSAKKGQQRAETAVTARLGAGPQSGTNASILAALGAEVGRRWSPICDVVGGDQVTVTVTFSIEKSGRLKGSPVATGENSDDNVVKVSAERAKRAVRQTEPFENLPAQFYQQPISLTFPAKEFCASG